MGRVRVHAQSSGKWRDTKWLVPIHCAMRMESAYSPPCASVRVSKRPHQSASGGEHIRASSAHMAVRLCIPGCGGLAARGTSTFARAGGSSTEGEGAWAGGIGWGGVRGSKRLGIEEA